MSNNNKTVAFARVSSKAQEDEGYSLDAQLKLIHKYCKVSGLNVVAEFRISETASKHEQRKVFREMLTSANKHNAAHLVVEKTDRLTRNMRDAVVVDDWLEADEKRRLHMVKEGLVVHKRARSDERLMWNIYLAFARKQVDNLREEAMKGWAEKLTQGWMPALPPHGYKTVAENAKKIHIIDEEKAPVIQRMFRFYLEPGQTVKTVKAELTACGITTKKGRPLTSSAVHKMLRNPFYVGVIRFDGRDYPGAHEPLLDMPLFNAVQTKLGGRSHSAIRRHDVLFRGLITCMGCNGMVTWQLQGGRYYGACNRRKVDCTRGAFVREDRVEEQVLAALRKVDDTDRTRTLFADLKQKLADLHQPYVGQHRQSVMQLITKQVHRSEIMKDNLYEDKLAGLLTDAAYAKKLGDIDTRLAQLQDRLERLEAAERKTGRSPITARTVYGLYAAESKAGKRTILASLFKLTRDVGRVNIENIWPNMQKPSSSDTMEG